MSTDIYLAYLSRTISYKDLQDLHKILRDRLSLDNLYGIHQLSIFDDIPEDELHPKPDDMIPANS